MIKICMDGLTVEDMTIDDDNHLWLCGVRAAWRKLDLQTEEIAMLMSAIWERQLFGV